MLSIEASAAEVLMRSTTCESVQDARKDMAKSNKTGDSAGGSSEPWLLRVEEAAELVGVSRSFLYDLISSGQVPSVRIGGCRRIRADQLREWIEQQSE